MYSKYFVLVTDRLFGVFEVKASSYPDEFLDNISAACTKESWEIIPYLIEKVGRNTLIKKGVDRIESIGEIFTR